ncbi:hypothetical protein F4861DRAFT_372180 [Xylaria intraflava]|nr:hypothetical protein F4861DRAFT_372180 [Xylaria intraflava]
MCRGFKVVMLCGHGEARFSRPCGLQCSAPRGPTTRLDKRCPPCEAEHAAQMRRDELKAQLLTGAQQTPGHTGSPLSPHAETRTRGRTPWDGDMAESDDDQGYLTDNGIHVIQKKYVSVNGHDAVISYRLHIREADPLLVRSLREKREKRLAKQRERERRRAKDGEDPMKSPMGPLLEERLREARERFQKELSEAPMPSPLLVEEHHKGTAAHTPDPARRPAAKPGRPPLRRMKRGAQVTRCVEDKEEESLDLWQTLADEYDDADGKTTPRRAR